MKRVRICSSPIVVEMRKHGAVTQYETAAKIPFTGEALHVLV